MGTLVFTPPYFYNTYLYIFSFTIIYIMVIKFSKYTTIKFIVFNFIISSILYSLKNFKNK